MKAIPITKVPHKEDIRHTSGFTGLDMLLGGGFVAGECLMFAGEPGVGKSTLLTQLCFNISSSGKKVLYISGEESLSQIRLRADRLKALSSNFLCSEEITLEGIFELVHQSHPKFLVVDSLQMVKSAELKPPAGSPVQMRFCLDKLIHFAKSKDIILVTIGHSTKSGLIAGLLTLQHMVDAVLFMTKEEEDRLVLAKKNRFGGTQTEWRVKMTETGIADGTKIIKSGVTLLPFTGVLGVILNPIYWCLLLIAIPFGLIFGTVKKSNSAN